ncbi:hypothetical protein KL911_004363 [Ogataea haglerorum]|uniref:uncharacterized protein n=1 Tax=Ogataea haglerorum TaxID=1937702 RepID=UPI001C8AC21F|nr:uncharacterized protein KL911_004363 [Ogataea haglerorum]KAG7751785.1 hypothetical protein KL911_004363 [Ogataea haglerorum]
MSKSPDESHSSAQYPPYNPYACIRCRRLKKRCTKDFPRCANCIKNNEQCTYVERKNRRRLPEQNFERVIDTQHAAPPAQRDSLPPIFARPVEVQPQSQPVFQRMNGPFGSSKELSSFTPQPQQSFMSTQQFLPAPGQKYLPTPQQQFQTPVLPPLPQKSAPLHNLVNRAAPGRGSSELFDAPTRKPDHEPAIDLIHSNLIHTIMGNKTPTPPLEPLAISKDLALQFVKAYLDHNNRSYPILNESEFLDKVATVDFDCFFQSRGNFDTSFFFELNMIAAIGCTTLERAGVIDKSKGYSKYFSSKSMSLLTSAVSFQDISSVRSLVLLGIYSFFDPKGLYSWSIVGILTRIAVSLGLNRKIRDVEAKRMTPAEIEMRHRLFWAVFNMDRLISTSFGRPVAIRDDDINVPLPEPIDGEGAETVSVTRNIIEMRRIEGMILTNVHCVKSSDIYPTAEDKNEILNKIRQDIEKWYSNSRLLSSKSSQKGNISFLESTAWFSARYYHMLMLLYRPSYLFPKPSLNNLEILGRACLQNLSFTYNLYTSNLLPLNWITLYRFLTTCTTILYCLCHWSIDLVESKTDIHLCVEILNGFSENWYFAKRCAEVFKTIDDAILDISMSSSNGQIQPVDQLLVDLMNTSSSYHEILFENEVDIWYGDDFMISDVKKKPESKA